MPYKDKEKAKVARRRWAKENSEKMKALKRKKYQESDGEVRARVRAWEQTPDGKKRIKGYKLKYKYGIDLDTFYAMIAEQGGVCAICRTPNWGQHGPIVDHDHKTGKVRGILCRMCNTTLGLTHDNPDILMSAVHYLFTSGVEDVS